jgi:EmrB/QacA subfamily drug resistance transporter
MRRVRIEDKWWVTIAVTLGMFMSLMDNTVVNVAIPQLQRTFGANIQAVQWVVTIYMLTQAAVIPTAPYLATRFGGKRAYVWTLTAFLLGSVLCGFAWNLPSLIFFRLIQGIGGGILLPLVTTLLYQAFPAEERGSAVSAMGIALMVAPTVGPVLGGFLVASFSWRWAFFINVPIGIVAIMIAQNVLRQAPATARTRFDGAGFLSIAVGTAALLYAVSSVTVGGNPLRNIVLFGIGIALVSAFVAIEKSKVRRGQEPLLDLRRFNDRTFAFGSLATVFVASARFGTLFLIPIYLQALRQLTALEAGTILAAQSVATLIVLPIGGRFADRLGPRPVVITGLSVLTSATLLMVTLALNTPIWMIVGIMLLVGCAGALTQQLSVAAMSRVRHEEHTAVAHGASLMTVLHATAAPLGVALLSSIVQLRSPHYTVRLAAEGLSTSLLDQQSTLFAMRESFLVASCLMLAALVAMWFVPNWRKYAKQQAELAPLNEAAIS